MEKYFVPYETTLKLRSLGFNEQCIGYYVELVNPVEGKLQLGLADADSFGCPAPLYDQVFEWFRDEFDAHITPLIVGDKYIFAIVWHGIATKTKYYSTYDKARLACIEIMIDEMLAAENSK